MALTRRVFETFVSNTSMRGFMKLYKTPHTLLRILWAIYLISMISLLCSACYFLVLQYTRFLITVQQSEIVQDITPMPSITICSERPIGDHAAQLWKDGEVLSPLQMHQQLRDSMRLAYNLSNFGKKRGKLFAAKDLFFADKISTYFQNLGVEDGRRIGVQSDDLILFCIMKHTKNTVRSISHDDICKVTLRWIRHPLYMNCYSLTIDSKVSHEMSAVSLILRSGLEPVSENAQTQQAQPFDLFTQSVGMRIALHDPGSLPSIDDHGVSIGLRKNTQIRYTLERNRRLNLGRGHSSCISEQELKSRQPLIDFGQNFSYSFHGCMSHAIGELIRQQCNCISAWQVVSHLPTAEQPFCDLHNRTSLKEMASRLDCVRNVQVQHRIKQLRRHHCLHRCDYHRYKMQISSSDWIPTQWQLKLILSVSPIWDVAASKRSPPEKKRQANQQLYDFLESKHPLHTVVNTTDFDLSRLTLVTITRNSYNTVLKHEVLQITLSTLLAQLGGMGSLTIGLTLTFLFEIFEFFFLLIVAWKQQIEARRKKRNFQNEDENENESSDELKEHLQLRESVVDDEEKIEEGEKNGK